MLLGQDLRRRHQGSLVAGTDRREHCREGHHGLAATDITLEEAKHRVGTTEVGLYLGKAALLGTSERERKRLEETGALDFEGECRRVVPLLPFRAAHEDGGLHCQEFANGEPLAGLLGCPGVGRVVVGADGFGHGRKALLPAEPLGHGVGNLVRKRLDGCLHGVPDGALAEPLGGRIDRLETTSLECVVIGRFVLRVLHLDAAAVFADTPGEDDALALR